MIPFAIPTGSIRYYGMPFFTLRAHTFRAIKALRKYWKNKELSKPLL